MRKKGVMMVGIVNWKGFHFCYLNRVFKYLPQQKKREKINSLPCEFISFDILPFEIRKAFLNINKFNFLSNVNKFSDFICPILEWGF